jgi:2,4-dienoyl-CoA reductase-like NADH-dependent reductase (Old Yellow Enzyme family)
MATSSTRPSRQSQTTRSDAYGGLSFENSTRFFLRVVEVVRTLWGENALFVRFSASDWAEGPVKGSDRKWLQWGMAQSILLIGELRKLGVDLIDVSSGGTRQHRRFLPDRGTKYGGCKSVA